VTEHLRRTGIGRTYSRRKHNLANGEPIVDMRLQLPGQMELDVSNWKRMRKNSVTEIRPYIPEEDLTGIDVSDIAKQEGSPKEGDFIARDPTKPQDQWLLTAEYVAANYVPAD